MKRLRAPGFAIIGALWLLSVFQAPWEISHAIYYEPLWSPPSDVHASTRLMGELLSFEWLAISIAAIGVWLLTRGQAPEESTPVKSIESRPIWPPFRGNFFENTLWTFIIFMVAVMLLGLASWMFK